MFDVAIIGAGVVGAMAARELSRYDLKICLLEKGNDVALGASKANSAIVHAGFDAKEGSRKAKLNVRGSEMMERVAGELGVRYRRNGSLVLGFDDADRRVIEDLYRRGKRNGVRALQILTGEQIRAVEPNVSSSATVALYAPTGAIICPYGLTIAAVGNAMDNGCVLKRNFEVKSITRQNGAWCISSGSETVYAGRVVNCAGLYADAIARMIGDDSFTVTPRRGEYMVLDRECGNLVRTTVFQTPSVMGKGILVTPTVDGNLLIGPTGEDIKEKTDTSTTAAGLALVRERAMRSVPGLDLRRVITSFSGLRAVGSTGDFILTRPVPGFLHAAGIESPGLTSSPAIAKEIRDLLADDGLELREKPDFNPFRRPMNFFETMTTEQKNALIRLDSRFGKTVCRCENVTEGEIVYAILANPGALDVDGVKRRTRSGMGRCQGGFCMPRVVEILARELGADPLKITKTGGGSWICDEDTRGGSAR